MRMQLILTPLFGTRNDSVGLNTAVRICARSGGHVVGLFVKPDPLDLVSFVPYGAPLNQVTQAAEKELDRQRDIARAQFDEVCKAADMPIATKPADADTNSAEWREVAGKRIETVLRYARLSDVVVFGRPETEAAPDRHATMLATLLGAGRPLLLVPNVAPKALGERVGIAWNGSLESARVLGAALPFVQAARSVHLLTAETEQTSYGITEELADYLAWHGVACERHQVLVEHGSVGTALLRKVSENHLDLLIMGGYGHSRLQEFILGGMTRHVLGHAETSVLMTH